MAEPVKVTCPSCGEDFPVPTEVVHIDRARNLVLCRLDRSDLYGHLQACVAEKPARLEHRPAEVAKALEATPAAQDPELVGRVHLFLSGGHFMAKGGSGACTMCGVARDGCLTGAKLRKTACCGACGDGNTHPAPMESRGTCAEWGAEHGAKP